VLTREHGKVGGEAGGIKEFAVAREQGFCSFHNLP
jgi:hypothetical protein